MHATTVEAATQLSFDYLPPEPAQPTSQSRRVLRPIRPDRFARRLDNRIAVLCRDLPPSAEPVLRAVVSAMAGSNVCRFSYPAFVEISSVSMSSFKRMIPLLRETGLLLAFTRDGAYVPPGTNVRSTLTLKLGPMFEIAQPELESQPNPQLGLRSGLSRRPGVVSDRDQSGVRQRPAPPPQNQRDISKEASAVAGGLWSSATADERRAALAAARRALNKGDSE